MSTKVSIIMPSLNVSKYIGECISSVLKQTLEEIEVLCVDAGSTDGTLEILESYAKKDSRVSIIHSEKRSYGYQVNLGIKESKGEYIGIVETDDIVDSKMFEELYQKAKEFDADVVKGPYTEYYSEKRMVPCYFIEYMKKIPSDKLVNAKEYGELLAYHASVWSGIYKKEYLVSKNIYFVEAPGAGYVDVDFRIQSMIHTDRIYWYNKPFYFYRVSAENSSTNNFKLGVMIQRWKEEHAKINKEDYQQYYGKYLIFDEYLNTIAYIGKISVTQEEVDAIVENVKDISEEMILSSPVLRENYRYNCLEFKKDPNGYYQRKNKLIKEKRFILDLANSIFPKGTKRRNIIKRMFVANK